MGVCGECGRFDLPYPGHAVCECGQSIAGLVKGNREFIKVLADIATLDRATDQAAARRMVKRAVFRRLNEMRGRIIDRFGGTDTEVPLLDELQRACLRVTRLAYPQPDAAELNKVREAMRLSHEAKRTMYLVVVRDTVVVCDTRYEEAHAQTVGLFDTQKEADDYAADLNAETQSDRAFVQPWLVGDMRL